MGLDGSKLLHAEQEEIVKTRSQIASYTLPTNDYYRISGKSLTSSYSRAIVEL